MRACIICGKPIDDMRIDSGFCSGTCRTRASRIRQQLKDASWLFLESIRAARGLNLDTEQHDLLSQIKECISAENG